MKAAKITLATVKKFIRENKQKLFINVKSDFDGMIDCIAPLHGGFVQAEADKTQSKNSDYHDRTQNIQGAWFVGGSRDYFNNYEDDRFTGISVSNCCGHFILAVPREENAEFWQAKRKMRAENNAAGI